MIKLNINSMIVFLKRLVIFILVEIVVFSNSQVLADMGENYDPFPPHIARGIAPEGYYSYIYDGSMEYRWDDSKKHSSRYEIYYNDAVFVGVTDKYRHDLMYWDAPLALMDGFSINDSFRIGDNLGSNSKVDYDIYSCNFHVTGIADYACFKMENMIGTLSGGRAKLPKYLEWIGDYSFFGCKALDVDFSTCHESLERIGKGAFKNCSTLTKVSLDTHDKLSSIGPEAFMNCDSLLQVDLPPNLKKVDVCCFAGDKSLLYAKMGNCEKLDTIWERAFAGCISLEGITLPKSLKVIGPYAFLNCALKGNLVIPDSVVEIHGCAFSGIGGLFSRGGGLTSLTIGKSVKGIDSNAFTFNSSNLKSVILKCQEPPISFPENFKKEVYDSCTLFVPTGTKVKYLEANGWREFKNIEEYGGDYILPTDISGICESYRIVNESSDPLVLAPGTSHILEASVEPENTTDKRLFWKSGDESIASISDNKIEMLKEGSTTLTLYHAGGLSKTIPLICGQPVNEITIPSEMLVYVGESQKIDFDILPASASSPKVDVYSQDPSIVKISKNWQSDWVIEGILPGTTTICIDATDGSGTVGRCIVNVNRPPITKINLNYNEWTNPYDYEGSKYKNLQLRADILPEYAENLIDWSSDNENVAVVDSNGLVTFNGYGKVKLRAASSENPNIYDECYINVDFEIDYTVNGSHKNSNDGLFYIDNTRENKLEVNTIPYSLPIEDLTWDNNISSRFDGETLATIDSEGNIVVLKRGSGYIVGHYMLCGNEYEIEIPISTSYYITSLELDRDTIEIKTGESTTLNAIYKPEDALLSDVISWSSNDENVVIVDQNGVVTGMNPGNATITARSSKVFDAAKATCEIIVTSKTIDVENIEIDVNNVVLKLQETIKLSATVRPDDATDKNVIWSSSDSAIAMVDEEGIVRAVGVGMAIITATASNGLSANCEISVLPVEAQQVILNYEEVVLRVNETLQLAATVLPEETTDKSVAWSTDNDLVVTVSENGYLRAISPGNVIITAKVADGSDVSAVCRVTVNPILIESVVLSPYIYDCIPGDSFQIQAKIYPEEASDKNLLWSTSDETVASVDSDGYVMAITPGNVIITAKATDGSETAAICSVTVNPILIESISLSPESWMGEEGDSFKIEAEVFPENATDKTLLWSSDNESVAMVDSEGKVSVLCEGSCIITAIANDGSGISAECLVSGIAGIEALFSESDSFDVYNSNGILIKKNCNAEYLKTLTPDVYIIRQGNQIRKMILR